MVKNAMLAKIPEVISSVVCDADTTMRNIARDDPFARVGRRSLCKREYFGSASNSSERKVSYDIVQAEDSLVSRTKWWNMIRTCLGWVVAARSVTIAV